MGNISFVKTVVPRGQYMDREKMGERYIIHLDPVEDKAMDAYVCVECSVPIADYDSKLVQEAYEEWKTKMQERALTNAIRSKVAEITSYDTSDKVNGFKLNGSVVWLDKATRVGLMNSTTIAKAAGQQTTTLWLGENKLEVDCDKAIQLLSALEMYALDCFNVTAKHKKMVSEMTSVEQVEAFDITADYPKQLEMTV